MLFEVLLFSAGLGGSLSLADHAMQREEIISPDGRWQLGALELFSAAVFFLIAIGAPAIRESVTQPDSIYALPAALIMGAVTGIGTHGLVNIIWPNR